MDSIKGIKVHSRDYNGNLVVNVLASANEYSIYEIDTPIPENRLRVYIDGINDEREEKLTSRFNLVKHNYLLAKSLLYRSSNFNLMKSRVAHVLATALSSDDPDPNKNFQILIDEIRAEYKKVVWRRVTFVLPAYTVLILLSINCLLINCNPAYLALELPRDIPKFLLLTVVGGVLSITYSLKKYVFETDPSKWFYFLLGWERISLALLAGVVVFVGIKSDLFLCHIFQANHYAQLFFGVVAGFSETCIPNILKKHASDV